MFIIFNDNKIEIDQITALKLKINLQVSPDSGQYKYICSELTKYGLGDYENNHKINVTKDEYDYIYQLYQKIL